MGLLTLEYDKSDFPSFARIAAALPTMSNQILGYVGNQAKRIAKRDILSGQRLNYRGVWRDKAGRPKVSYGIRYAQYVTIRSYPANFFTASSNNRKHRKLPIWSDLKYMVNGQLDFILRTYDQKYLEPQFKKFSEKALSRDRW